MNSELNTEQPLAPEAETAGGLTAEEEELWSPPETVHRFASGWLIHLIKACIATGLIILLVRTIRLAALEEALAGANIRLILAAALLMPVNVWLQAARWRVAIRAEMPEVTFRQAFTSFLGGASMGIITPGRVGEIGRVFLLQPKSRVRLAGLHVLDKLYFIAALACFGPALVYQMPGFSGQLHEQLRTPLLIATSILPLFFFAFAYSPNPLKNLLVLMRRSTKVKGAASDLLHALDRIRVRDSRSMAAFTLLQFAVILTQFYLLSRAFQVVSWVTAARTYVASLFVKSLLPISLGDLGVSEWAAVSFYQCYGIADTTAFSASLFIFAINILLPALAGALVLQRAKAPDLVGRMTRRFRGPA